MNKVFEGSNCSILASNDGMIYKVINTKGKVKTFKGETAWSDAQRHAWDLGDLHCCL